jgi:hypothetical protein
MVARPPSRRGWGQACSLGKHSRQSRDRRHGILIMQTPIVSVIMYSLDGLLADEGTEHWQFCVGLPQVPNAD